MSEETDRDEMLEDLIKFFSVECRGHITKTQLLKMLYLADLYSVKWAGHQLTQMDWRLYHNGPWSLDYEEALDSLEQRGFLYKHEERGVTLIRPYEDSESPIFEPLLYFSLENIRQRWAGAGHENFKRLLEFVYDTEPMKAHDLSDYNRSKKRVLDLTLEHQALKNDSYDRGTS